MSKRPSLTRAVAATEDLADHLATFLESFVAAGYAAKTRRDKGRFVASFIRWVRHAGIGTTELDESFVRSYRERTSRRPHKRHDPERAALHQFLEHLRSVGVAPPRQRPESSPVDALVGRYVEHLRRGRGLAHRSIGVYTPFVREFVTAMGPETWDDPGATLDASVVRSFLLDRAHGQSSQYTKLLATALRSFLRFLFLYAETAADLSTAVPPVRRWRYAAVSSFLLPQQVEQVIAATDSTTVRGRRALAMLLLLARLGLRAGEVATLELDDIHWGTGEIVVRGKGDVHDRMPLLEDVGEALALYIQRARGQSTSRRVFLRLCAPRVGLSGPTAVCIVARNALTRAGLQPAGRVGAHIFRHSLATRLIRQGASVGEIAQVLRHRCTATTQIYARVDFETLRGVARPWPTTGGRR